MKLDFPYLSEDEDRYGNDRIYVRRNGRRIRLREQKGTLAFAKAYAEALEALEASGSRKPLRPDQRAPAAPGTLGWLAAAYFASKSTFLRLDPASQRRRRNLIEECLLEPIKPGSTDLMAQCPISRITSHHVQMLRDRRADHPGAANNRKKYLSAMFGWAVEAKHMTINPARDARRIDYATDGFHTWSIEELKQFEVRHPIGTKARLALALLLYLGVRRSDVILLGRQHVKDGLLSMVPRKTRFTTVELSIKPILPELAKIIAASPCGDVTFLINNWGRPFASPAAFGNWFRDRCNEAGLPQCSAHGLRKAGATIAADNGATDRQLMALFDWSSATQATRYTKKADKRRLAGVTARLIEEQMMDEDCHTTLSHS